MFAIALLTLALTISGGYFAKTAWQKPAAVLNEDDALFCLDPYDNLQPRSISFNSLAELREAKDPFFDFNKGTQKLKRRLHDNKGAPKITILDDRGPDSGRRCFDGPPQGANNYTTADGKQRTAFPRWVFGRWAYIDIYVFFSHNMFAIPPAVWINAAHKNGVLALGTIIFEHDTIDQLNEMVRDKNVAQKLIDLAQAYGFDGYFINFEASGNVDVNNTYIFMDKLRKAGLYVQWYDSVITDGTLSYQNALTEKNKLFFDHSSSMFTNYWWPDNQIIPSQKLAGIRADDVFTGIDVYARGASNEAGEVLSSLGKIFDESTQRLRTSVGIFAPAWSFFKADPDNLLADYKQKDEKIWLSQGVGSVISPNSPITELPFLTNFNQGQGQSYYRDGILVSLDDWNHLSQQDIPLTFMHDSSAKKDGFYVEENYDHAWHGGSSLAVYGQSNVAQTIDLFKTDLPINTETSLSLMVGIPDHELNIAVRLFLEFDDNSKYLKTYLIADPAKNYVSQESKGINWQSRSFILPKNLIKHRITKISLRIESDHMIKNDGDALIYLGELKIADTAGLKTAVPIISVQNMTIDRNKKILSWPEPISPYQLGCEYYDVSARDYKSRNFSYLGRAYANSYAYDVNIINNKALSGLNFTYFHVLCVNKYGNKSKY